MKRLISVVLVAIFIFLSYQPAVASSAEYQWTKTFSGVDVFETVNSVTHDSAGSVYTTGCFAGTNVDFNPSATETDLHSSAGDCDLFITKFGADDSYQWTKTTGDIGSQYGEWISVDPLGNFYVGGMFNGTVDFDFSGATQNLTTANPGDAFLCKYTADFSFSWCRQWGGTANNEYVNKGSFDADGNVYVTGLFLSADVDFDVGPGTELHSTIGSYDIFVLKIQANGDFGWAKTWGSTALDKGVSIEVANDALVVGGYFRGLDVDFDSGGGVDTHSSDGTNPDAFLTKFDLDGVYGWTKTWGGSGGDALSDILLGDDGKLYLVGYFSGTDVDFDPSGAETLKTSLGSSDTFLAQYEVTGQFNWVQTLGTSGSWIVPWEMSKDDRGNLYLALSYGPTMDFDSGANEVIRSTSSSYEEDVAILSYTTAGVFNWVHTFSSSVWADPYAITYNPYTQAVYFGGLFGIVTNFDPFGSQDTKTSDVEEDAYLTKLSVIFPSVASVVSSTAQVGASTNSNQPEVYQILLTDNTHSGGVFRPIGDSSPGSQSVLVILEPATLGFNSFLSSISQSSEDLRSIFALTTFNKNRVLFNGKIGFSYKRSMYWQVGPVQKIAFKAYPPSGSDKSAAVIIPSLQKKASILALSYTAADLIPPGDMKNVFKAENLKMAYSVDGLKWEVLPNSAVNTATQTVSVVHKIGGYYMIVAPSR